jgi:PAS domain-containing protein
LVHPNELEDSEIQKRLSKYPTPDETVIIRKGRAAHELTAAKTTCRNRRFVIIRDISERKKREALTRSEAFLDNIIEHSPHAMWISDDKGPHKTKPSLPRPAHIRDEEVVAKYNASGQCR